MSQDQFTEVTCESWFSRIGGAIKGVLVGVVLFGVSFPLLSWNEGRAVKTYQSLNEGAAAVRSVSADAVDSAQEGKLIHLSGKAITEETLSDPVFGVSAKALSLRRVAEMYQWAEASEGKTKKKLGGGSETTTTYTYSKQWSEEPIDSAKFKQPDGHQNPGALPYTSSDWTAKEARVGAFRLSPAQVNRIGNPTQLVVSTNASAANLPAELRLQNAGYYRGKDPLSPQVGDVRISFKVVEPQDVSVVARQAGNSLEPYPTKAGGKIELIETGIHSAAAMFQTAQANNRLMTWVLRFVGFLVMLVGLNMVLKPLSVLADVLPLLGNIVAFGTGWIAFLVAGVLSFITIAIAWIAYRPLVGILTLCLAVGLAVVVLKLRRGARAGAAPA